MSRLRLWIFALALAGVTRWVHCQNPGMAGVTDPVVGAKVGFPANLSCSSFNNPISVCLWEKTVPGSGPFVISIAAGVRNEQPTGVAGYIYKGQGLDRGECGLGIKNVKEEDNAKWSCTLITANGLYRGNVDVSILKKPGPPQFQPPTLSDFTETRDYQRDTEINCYAPNGQPPPKFNWFLGDEPITEGLSPVNVTTSNGQHFTFQILKRKFTWKDNGKPLKCVMVHEALSDTDRKETKEIAKTINFKFAPRSEDGSSASSKMVYVPEVGMRQPLSINISANPRPSNVYWDVDGVRINEGRTSPDKRFESQNLREITPGVYEASLIIVSVADGDLNRAYKLTVDNQYGSGNFEIKISSTDPGSGGLSAGGIVGLVLGIPACLIIVAVGVVYARSRGLLCFKGDDGTSSEKERMDGESNGGGGEEKPEPVARRLSSRLSALYENLVKKRDKTAPADEEAAKGEKEKEGEDGEKKPDDIVYAELDLARGAPEAGNPVVVRCADDKTEYAEIIGVVPQGEETNGVKDKPATPSPKK